MLEKFHKFFNSPKNYFSSFLSLHANILCQSDRIRHKTHPLESIWKFENPSKHFWSDCKTWLINSRKKKKKNLQKNCKIWVFDDAMSWCHVIWLLRLKSYNAMKILMLFVPWFIIIAQVELKIWLSMKSLQLFANLSNFSNFYPFS